MNDDIKQQGDISPSTNEEIFSINLVFKPVMPGQILRPEEMQLLHAYIGEILEEIEIEEKRIIEEEQKAAQEVTNRKNSKENAPCK